MSKRESFLKTLDIYQPRWLTVAVASYLVSLHRNPELLPVAFNYPGCIRSKRIKKLIRTNVRRHWQEATGTKEIYFPYTLDAVATQFAFLAFTNTPKEVLLSYKKASQNPDSRSQLVNDNSSHMNPYYIMLAVIHVCRENQQQATLVGLTADHAEWTTNEWRKKDLEDRVRKAWISICRNRVYLYDFPFTRDAVSELYHRVAIQKNTLIDKWEAFLYDTTKPQVQGSQSNTT